VNLTVVSLSSTVVILVKNMYLEELLETCILRVINTGCYDALMRLLVQVSEPLENI
jgi:uncharacterized protein YggT (Ycf19 family)